MTGARSPSGPTGPGCSPVSATCPARSGSPTCPTGSASAATPTSWRARTGGGVRELASDNPGFVRRDTRTSPSTGLAIPRRARWQAPALGVWELASDNPAVTRSGGRWTRRRSSAQARPARGWHDYRSNCLTGCPGHRSGNRPWRSAVGATAPGPGQSVPPALPPADVQRPVHPPSSRPPISGTGPQGSGVLRPRSGARRTQRMPQGSIWSTTASATGFSRLWSPGLRRRGQRCSALRSAISTVNRRSPRETGMS